MLLSSHERLHALDSAKTMSGLLPLLTQVSLLTEIEVTVNTPNTSEYEGCTPTEQYHSIDSLYAS